MKILSEASKSIKRQGNAVLLEDPSMKGQLELSRKSLIFAVADFDKNYIIPIEAIGNAESP